MSNRGEKSNRAPLGNGRRASRHRPPASESGSPGHRTRGGAHPRALPRHGSRSRQRDHVAPAAAPAHRAKEPIYLMTARSTYTVYVPVSARYTVRSCKLHLKFSNSTRPAQRALDPAASSMTRRSPSITSRGTSPTTSSTSSSREIPRERLEQLQFIVSQHYTLECEDPSAPELWTQIYPDESLSRGVVTWANIYPKLSLLKWLIDKNLWEPLPVQHLHARLRGRQLHALAALLGLRRHTGRRVESRYRPLKVNTGSALHRRHGQHRHRPR